MLHFVLRRTATLQYIQPNVWQKDPRFFKGPTKKGKKKSPPSKTTKFVHLKKPQKIIDKEEENDRIELLF